MFELQLLIPVADNDGHHFSPDEHSAFEQLLVERFGGYTRLPGAVGGAWVNAEGVTYRDRTRLYGVAILSILDAAKLGDVVDVAKRHYRQEAIYVRYLGVSEAL